MTEVGKWFLLVFLVVLRSSWSIPMTIIRREIVPQRKVKLSPIGRCLQRCKPAGFRCRRRITLYVRYLAKLREPELARQSDSRILGYMLVEEFRAVGTRRDRQLLREGMNGRSTVFSFHFDNVVSVVSEKQRMHKGDPAALLESVTQYAAMMLKDARDSYGEYLSFRWVQDSR